MQRCLRWRPPRGGIVFEHVVNCVCLAAVSRHVMVVVVRLYVRERCQVHREDQVVVVGAAAFVVMVVVGSMALESRYRDCCR